MQNDEHEFLVKQPYSEHILGNNPEFVRARLMANARPKDAITRIRIEKEPLYKDQQAQLLYGAFVSNGDGTSLWCQALYPASKENPTEAQILTMAEQMRQKEMNDSAKLAESARKNLQALKEKGIVVGLELLQPQTYVDGKKGLVTFSRAKVVVISAEGYAEVHATLKGSPRTYIFKVDAQSRLFDKVGKVAEQRIRDAFRALASVSLGCTYPITVSHNGVSVDFLASQHSLPRGDSASTLHLKTIKAGKLIASDQQGAVVVRYRLTGKNVLLEDGYPHYATEDELAEWTAAGFRNPIETADDGMADRMSPSA